jgi:hypothetical protein
MKTILKLTRRRETRRERTAVYAPIRLPSPAQRDMIAYAAALEILG